MHNNLDKQPVKQNTPIVAIGGCGQDISHNDMISYFYTNVKRIYTLIGRIMQQALRDEASFGSL